MKSTILVAGLLVGLSNCFAFQMPSTIQKRATAVDSSLGVCDLSKAQMPVAPTPLPSPPPGAVLTHVAIGRGTQNYSCADSTSKSIPVQVGANATLFNATCAAVQYPALLAELPKIAVALPVPQIEASNSPVSVLQSGIHYFQDTTTPFFNLDTLAMNLGSDACTKKNASSAPNPSDVPWLYLTVKNAVGNQISTVYRLETSGGVAPATCAGQPPLIYVDYSAQYWFWTAPATPS